MMVETADNWPVGYTITCPSCYATTDVTNDNVDASAGPYANSAGVKMYNFACPQCGTQNGISEGATSETAAAPAPAAPANQPAPAAPVAPATQPAVEQPAAPVEAPVVQPVPAEQPEALVPTPVVQPEAPAQAEAAPAPMTVVPAAEPFAGHPSGPHFGGALGAARESQG